MAGLFGGAKPPAPIPPPPTPTLNQAQSDRDAQDAAIMAARGRQSTILTSQNGLPNLGTTTSAQATAGKQ